MEEVCMQCEQKAKCVHLSMGCYCQPCLDKRLTALGWVLEEARKELNQSVNLKGAIRVYDAVANH
jgi:hypothetical protein